MRMFNEERGSRWDDDRDIAKAIDAYDMRVMDDVYRSDSVSDMATVDDLWTLEIGNASQPFFDTSIVDDE